MTGLYLLTEFLMSTRDAMKANGNLNTENAVRQHLAICGDERLHELRNSAYEFIREVNDAWHRSKEA